MQTEAEAQPATDLPVSRIGTTLWINSDHNDNASWRVHRAASAGNRMAIAIGFDSGRFSAQGWLSIDQARALIAMLTEQVAALESVPAEVAA